MLKAGNQLGAGAAMAVLDRAQSAPGRAVTCHLGNQIANLIQGQSGHAPKHGDRDVRRNLRFPLPRISPSFGTSSGHDPNFTPYFRYGKPNVRNMAKTGKRL